MLFVGPLRTDMVPPSLPLATSPALAVSQDFEFNFLNQNLQFKTWYYSFPRFPNEELCVCVCVFQYTTYFCSALMSLVCVCERVLGVRMEYKGSGRSYQPLFNISHYHMCAYFSRTSPHTFLYLSLSRVRLPLLIYVSHITRCIAHALITSDNEECHLRWV